MTCEQSSFEYTTSPFPIVQVSGPALEILRCRVIVAYSFNQRGLNQHFRGGEIMSMFCRQCEQAAKETGCEVMGVCGKNPEVAALLDLMLFGLKGLAIYAEKARTLDTRYEVADMFLIEGLFTTVTNVDFDPVQLAGKLRKCYDQKEKIKALYESAYRGKTGNHAP